MNLFVIKSTVPYQKILGVDPKGIISSKTRGRLSAKNISIDSLSLILEHSVCIFKAPVEDLDYSLAILDYTYCPVFDFQRISLYVSEDRILGIDPTFFKTFSDELYADTTLGLLKDKEYTRKNIDYRFMW